MWAVLIIPILFLIIMPIAALWALNILFNLDLSYSILNWLAIVILIAVIHPGSMKRG